MGGEFAQRGGELVQGCGELVEGNTEKRGTPKSAGGDFWKTGNRHTLVIRPSALSPFLYPRRLKDVIVVVMEYPVQHGHAEVCGRPLGPLRPAGNVHGEVVVVVGVAEGEGKGEEAKQAEHLLVGRGLGYWKKKNRDPMYYYKCVQGLSFIISWVFFQCIVPWMCHGCTGALQSISQFLLLS